MPATRASFLLLDASLDGARSGDRLTLGGSEGHHAARVARIGIGEEILLTDPAGHQAPARVLAAAKESLALELITAPSAPVRRTPRLALVQALATGGRDEQAVESATELGVDRITPWIAQRSVAVWRGEKLQKGRARWEATVRAAVKQCRRPGIPVVDAPVDSRALADQMRERTAAGGLVLLLHEQESAPLLEAVAGAREALAAGEIPEITVIVGPEGGIAEPEREALCAAGARSVLLGPEVLRSSTAGPAAIAVLSALVGRWG